MVWSYVGEWTTNGLFDCGSIRFHLSLCRISFPFSHSFLQLSLSPFHSQSSSINPPFQIASFIILGTANLLLSSLFSRIHQKNKKANHAKTTHRPTSHYHQKKKSLSTAFLSRASPFSLFSSSFHPLAHGSRDCRMAAACSADNWGKHAPDDLTGHAFSFGLRAC